MKKFYLLFFAIPLCFILFPVQADGQNLVNNMSFESGAWTQANSGSADWLTASNVFGNQTPRSGTRMMGEAFGRYNGFNFREYIKAPLTSPMVIGQAYYFEIWLSLADVYGTYGSDNHCFAFTTMSPYFPFTTPAPMSPQFINPNQVLSQTTWTQVAGTIVADSAYTWVTIGNFFNEASTNFTFVGGNSFNYAYYFMDDVTVQQTVILDAEFDYFTAEGIDDQYVDLNWAIPSSSEGKQFEIHRSLNGTSFEKIATIRATQEQLDNGFSYSDKTAPYGQKVYYRILQNDNNGNIHYSEVRSVTLNIDRPGNLVGVYPTVVPTYDQFFVEYYLRKHDSNIRVEVIDATGRVVIREDLAGKVGINKFPLSAINLKAGAYFVNISVDGNKDQAKILVIN